MNFKKRVNGSWTDTPHYIHNTSTDTLTTLPADIYVNDTTATVGLKGNMSQTGTPTPQNPIQPSECGDLETVGEKAGQYKIPISSASTTTPVYLGEVESTRKIKKVVLDGTENFTYRSGTPSSIFFIEIASTDYITNVALCSHYINTDTGLFDTMEDKHCLVAVSQYGTKSFIGFRDTSYTSDSAGAKDFKTYLAQQYAAGTPVTVWYAIATPTTGIVNEPLRKIGDYADTVSGITIPTIAGANTLSVGTTLQPSEVTVNYKGWHPVTDVHERENGAWD